MTDDLPAPSDRNFLFYDTEDGTTRVQLLVDGQTVWMPQNAIAELFETSKQNVGQHIKNILEDSELSEDSVVKNYFTTAADGKKYRTKHYNLDMAGLALLDWSHNQAHLDVQAFKPGANSLQRFFSLASGDEANSRE